MKIYVLSALFFFLFNFHFVKVQNITNTPCTNAAVDILSLVYNNEIDSAQALKDYYCTNNTDEAALLQAHIIRWKYLPVYLQKESIVSPYINLLQSIAESEELLSDYQSFIQLNAFLLLAEFYYNKNETMAAVKYGGKAYSLIKPKLAEENLSDEWLLVAGLYNYFYSYYLNKNMAYHSLLFFFKEGDKNKGLQQLDRASSSNTIVQAESLIYLSHIFLRLENKADRSLIYAKRLTNQFPNNPKFYEFYIEASIANNQVDDKTTSLIKALKNSQQVYYQKYGRTYEAIINNSSNVEIFKEAINFVNANGGGNHLLSLLYTKLSTKTSNNKSYLEKIKEYKVYDYVLTRP
ncbi:hypothetical protein C9994_05930 [Marivirga lumbricoides]|uniref:Uncharacterized protein n=1 Tax=Marivirga lumbricoides TaxID=1046115 RepID=A0A2T4DSG5_9BACT|nr:hypothetical protein C9994_05930 [Marivirga lumbricoides]